MRRYRKSADLMVIGKLLILMMTLVAAPTPSGSSPSAGPRVLSKIGKCAIDSDTSCSRYLS
jgi:hypothetical protein